MTDEYAEIGFYTLCILTIIVVVIYTLWISFTKYTLMALSVTAGILGTIAGMVLFYYTCVGVGYIVKEFPRKLEKWK